MLRGQTPPTPEKQRVDLLQAAPLVQPQKLPEQQVPQASLLAAEGQQQEQEDESIASPAKSFLL